MDHRLVIKTSSLEILNHGAAPRDNNAGRSATNVLNNPLQRRRRRPNKIPLRVFAEEPWNIFGSCTEARKRAERRPPQHTTASLATLSCKCACALAGSTQGEMTKDLRLP